MEIEQVIELSATPESVWSVLTDFDNYESWTNAVRMEGEPTSKAMAVFVILPGPGSTSTRPFRVEGEFALVNKPSRLEFAVGIRGLLALWCGYDLTRTEVGVQVRHYYGIGGFLAPIMKANFSRAATPLINRTCRDLSRFFSLSTPNNIRNLNRHQRRKVQQRRGQKL